MLVLLACLSASFACFVLLVPFCFACLLLLSAYFLARVPVCLLVCMLCFARLQLTLYNKAGDEVAKLESLESGGQTDDFEEFEFDEAVKGSKIRINVRGTTAGLWNGITEVRALAFASDKGIYTKLVVEISGLILTLIGVFAAVWKYYTCRTGRSFTDRSSTDRSQATVMRVVYDLRGTDSTQEIMS